MDAKRLGQLGPKLDRFLNRFADCFKRKDSFQGKGGLYRVRPVAEMADERGGNRTIVKGPEVVFIAVLGPEVADRRLK